ncbi:MAG: helicase HerA domain-containing protein, partial [Candidatus Hodarchaeales archaeon]
MGDAIRHIYEFLKNRFILFTAFMVIFVVLNFSFRGTILPSVGTNNLWFYSGIVMVLFSILFIEPYYTSPKNVITNSIPLLLVLVAIRGEFANPIIWWIGTGILALLLLSSVVALALENKNKSPESWYNRTSGRLKNCVVLIGQGKILYSAVFIYFLLTYYSIQDYYTLLLFVVWFFVLVINPKRIKSTFATKKERFDENALGEIFSVQSKKIFLVKLFEDRKGITKFDIVRFRYTMQDYDDRVITGIVFDTYLLNQEKWTKVLQLRVQREENSYLDKNIVFKITDKTEKEMVEKDLNIDNFVGVVIEGSEIGKIKFEYSKKIDDIQEGDLLELSLDKKRLFYQVVGGMTDKERLEIRNETGFVKGEAIQLGEWQAEKLSFQKFGWVPTINTPIFKADTSNIVIQEYKYPEYELGVIPGTILPSVINLREAVSHHMALLGVTGAGKTFIAREIIKELMSDTKVICVDFTGEYKSEFDSLKPTYLIDKDGLFKVEEIIAKKETATKMKNS